MNSELKTLSGVRRELVIELPSEAVDPELNKIVRTVAKKARIQGFRPGKVPINIVRSQFAEEIQGELLERLLPKATQDALLEHQLRPLAAPAYKDVSVAAGEPLKFTAAFEVAPAIEAEGYTGLALTDAGDELSGEEVDAELERLRERGASFETRDSPALEGGDYALADIFSQPEDGEAETQEKVLVEVPATPVDEDHLGARLLGAAPGETREFSLQHAGSGPDEPGKAIAYRVTVHAVKAKKLPELDDEFAKDLGEFQSLEQLRKHVTDRLESDRSQRRTRDLEKQLQEALGTRMTFEAPSVLVEQELDEMLEQQARALHAGGVDLRSAGIDWAEARRNMRESAVRSVKWYLYLDAIADKESVTVGAEEIEARLEGMAERAQRSVEYVRSKLAKDGQTNMLEVDLRRRKAVDFLIRDAKISKRSS